LPAGPYEIGAEMLEKWRTGASEFAPTLFGNRPVGRVMATTFCWHSHSGALMALPICILMGEILLRSCLSRACSTGSRSGSGAL
jgi:hypothetical protein